MAIKPGSNGAQQGLLIGKAFCNAALTVYRMTALRQFPATDSQPVIQLGKRSKARQRREQPFTHIVSTPNLESFARCLTGLQPSLFHQQSQVDNAVRKAPFIVVPREDLDELAADDEGGEPVDDG